MINKNTIKTDPIKFIFEIHDILYIERQKNIYNIQINDDLKINKIDFYSMYKNWSYEYYKKNKCQFTYIANNITDFYEILKDNNIHFIEIDNDYVSFNINYYIEVVNNKIEITNNLVNKDLKDVELNNLLNKVDNLISNKSETPLNTLYEELNKIIQKEKELNKNLVYLDEAIIHYLNGKKVRRYINQEIKELINKISKIEKKRLIEVNFWENNWVYNDKGKKLTNKDIPAFSLSSPIEVFEREGVNKYKLWEIESIN